MLSKRTFTWLAEIFPATRLTLGQVPSNDLPREHLLSVDNPEGTVKSAGCFKIGTSMPATSRRFSIRRDANSRYMMVNLKPANREN